MARPAGGNCVGNWATLMDPACTCLGPALPLPFYFHELMFLPLLKCWFLLYFLTCHSKLGAFPVTLEVYFLLCRESSASVSPRGLGMPAAPTPEGLGVICELIWRKAGTCWAQWCHTGACG